MVSCIIIFVISNKFFLYSSLHPVLKERKLHTGIDIAASSGSYDISDYEDVDPLFGSLADLDELIAALHERGMRLVMDLVVNHTSDEHPWFAASRSRRDDPKRDWYIWRPARDVPGLESGSSGTEPTNWGSAFSGSAWVARILYFECFIYHLFAGIRSPLFEAHIYPHIHGISGMTQSNTCINQ